MFFEKKKLYELKYNYVIIEDVLIKEFPHFNQ